MFYEGNKRKQVPSNQDPEKLESFFNCAATLMTDNLQQLTLNSLDDYSDLLCQPPVRPISKLYRSIFLEFLLASIQITCIKGVILFFSNRHLLVHMSTPDSFWDSSWMEPPSNLNQPSKNLKSSSWMCMMSWSKHPNKCQEWRQSCT